MIRRAVACISVVFFLQKVPKIPFPEPSSRDAQNTSAISFGE